MGDLEMSALQHGGYKWRVAPALSLLGGNLVEGQHVLEESYLAGLGSGRFISQELADVCLRYTTMEPPV